MWREGRREGEEGREGGRERDLGVARVFGDERCHVEHFAVQNHPAVGPGTRTAPNQYHGRHTIAVLDTTECTRHQDHRHSLHTLLVLDTAYKAGFIQAAMRLDLRKQHLGGSRVGTRRRRGVRRGCGVRLVAAYARQYNALPYCLTAWYKNKRSVQRTQYAADVLRAHAQAGQYHS